ncbi:aldose 1-epimerase [Aureibacter tunicatorum]|nr:aldose 1-epimerase [Aureibacter tunicatorum]
MAFLCLQACESKRKQTTGYQLYQLENKNGLKLEITNLGGRIVSLQVPDNQGRLEDVVLGHSKLENYLEGEAYFGALIGRFANRIRKGKFFIGDEEYTLPINNGENTLHGGLNGLHNVIWDVVEIEGGQGLMLSYLSKDGEEGFPGNLDIKVIYRLNDNDAVEIEYRAVSDQVTPVNLTNHAFFNLTGAGKDEILGHELFINADYFTPVDKGLIPTGEIKTLDNSPLDFRLMTPIGARIDAEDEQLTYGQGYDHNYCLNRASTGLEVAAKVFEPVSGRLMTVFTTAPGLQFYSGNFLNGSDIGKEDLSYEYRTAFCLETQLYPDSPNQPDFPNAMLNPGEVFQSTTVYQFETVDAREELGAI